ncbi:MAG: protein kinase [Planctomycetaceae bacterium]|nr:protein kinase [Planctomycetaceae bacterium]
MVAWPVLILHKNIMSSADSSKKRTLNDLTNAQFDDYQVLRRIGSGAMADVYVAQQVSLGRLVAIKVLKSEFSKDETYVKRFVREAKAAARLVHPNIVHIYEVGEWSGLRYIVQEYVQGINLAQFLSQHGAMSPRHVFLMMWQVASALELAAKSGIVHRDIKPENILISEQKNMKVADFGLARVEDTTDQELQLTKIGMTLGTPLYMSPEQSEGKTLDHRSDIYSFGITCYHMLAGFPPFRGDTALSVAIQHLKKEPELLELIRPDIPPAMSRIVHKMIAKAPENRYQSLTKLKTDLKQLHALVFREDSSVSETLTDWDTLQLDVLDTSLIAVTEKLQSTMVFETSLLKKRRKNWVLVTAGVLAVFLIGVFWGLHPGGAKQMLQIEELAAEIPQMDTVQKQWALAAMRRTPEAWKSIERFPNQPYWNAMAKRQLAWYYFADQPQKAKPYFQDLATKSSDQEDILIGTIGLAWVSAEENDMTQTERRLKTIEPESVPLNNEIAVQILQSLHFKHNISINQYLTPNLRRP